MSTIQAFTAEHVCRLTGLSSGQLRYWDRTEFFSPTLIAEDARRFFRRIYSFRDVVGLRTISILRNEHRISLQELRRVGAWLKCHHETPWSSLRFALFGKKVVFRDPVDGTYVEPRGAGQSVLDVALEPIAQDMERASVRLTERSVDQIGRIVRNRYVVHNAWVIDGTRIPTSAVWNLSEGGYSVDDIIREYPRLSANDVAAALEFERKRKAA